jgi:hypothetical protein
MKDFKLYTQFNFAKCVHLSLLSVPEGNLCSSPEGIIRFIKPYLRDTFAYDPEACFGQAPKVNEFENLYTVTVPFTC